MFIKWSFSSSKDLEWLAYFEHVVQSLLNTHVLVSTLRSTLDHIPFKYMCPYDCYVGIKHAYLKGCIVFLFASKYPKHAC